MNSANPQRRLRPTPLRCVDCDPCLSAHHRMVVLDNLQAHKAIGVQQAIARRGACRLYRPPYSPALSPNEPCGSKLKTALRKAKARTRAALDAAIAEALVTVSHTDARGWFKHCDYTLMCKLL